MSSQGLLFIISGPSGVGKGTICQMLREKNPQLAYSISATTRQPRVNELDGVNYFFMTQQKFASIIDEDGFLEYANIYGNYYGTLKSNVEKMQAEGRDVLLEIDTQGAMQIKSACPDGIFIFILPPSLEELKRRIINRGSENEESLEKRTQSAQKEIDMAKEYQYHVINNDLQKAVEEIENIIKKSKIRLDIC